MTDTKKKFEPVYNEHGRRVRITGMAASSIRENLYSVSRCTECGSTVAWAQSNKTQKWYPCETAQYTTEGGNPRFRAMPYEPHRCRDEVWVLREENPYGIYKEFKTQDEALEAKTEHMRSALETYEAYQEMLAADDITEQEVKVYTHLSETFKTLALGATLRIEMHYK